MATTSADTQQWLPTLGSVEPNMTVAEQMRLLLAENSPYLRQARQGAQRTANSRGLLNSTIAAGAGEEAAIKSALPIAAQDANTYFSQGQANQNAQNQAGQFNAAATNTFKLTDFQLKQQLASDLEKMGLAQQYNLDTMSQQQINDMAKMVEEQKNTQANMATQLAQDLEKMGLAQQYNLSTMSQQQINDLAKMVEAHTQDIEKMNLQGGINEQLARVDAELKNTLANGDDARLRGIEAAKNAAALNAQFIQGAAQINQSDMSVADKKAQINALREQTNSAIRDVYRMFLPDAPEAEVDAAVTDANVVMDSLQAINDRLDKITADINRPTGYSLSAWGG